jgi:hypothetical protein
MAQVSYDLDSQIFGTFSAIGPKDTIVGETAEHTEKHFSRNTVFPEFLH